MAEFSLHFADHVMKLYGELAGRTYRHSGYQFFKINDPKPRDIHKASVRDRLLHHALCKVLYAHFDRTFIYDSYSCRTNKGAHLAMDHMRDFALKVSRNHTRTAWVLKCDIRKFFANIDHDILLSIMKRTIGDADAMWLLHEVINSFHTKNGTGKGLPLGNLTSQLFANVYMNDFDQFMKRELKIRYYIRYADDFVIVHENKQYVVDLIPKIAEFLNARLKLSLHPDKVFIKTLASGVDFLGWTHFPHHRTLRTATKRRMFRNLLKSEKEATAVSYLGLLSHGNAHKLSIKVALAMNGKIER